MPGEESCRNTQPDWDAAPDRGAAPDRKASEWEGRRWFPPGPQLALCLSGEDRHRLAHRSDAELIEVMAAAHRQTAWAQARELAAIAELVTRREAEDRRDATGDQPDDPRILSAEDSLIEEISVALTVTGNAAATLMHIARRLSRTLPGTRSALEHGAIDLPKARVICDATEALPDHSAALLETAVLERAPSQTTGQLRRRTRTLARRLEPDAYEDRAEQTVRDRRVELWDNTSGTSSLALLDISDADAQAVHNKLTAVARAIQAERRAQERATSNSGQGTSEVDPIRSGNEPVSELRDGFDCGRTLDQIRADLAIRLLRGHALPEAISTLLRESESPAPDLRPAPDAPSSGRGAQPPEDAAPPLPPDLTARPNRPPIVGLPHVPTPPTSAEDSAEAKGSDRNMTLVAALAISIEQRLERTRAQLRHSRSLTELPGAVTKILEDTHRALTPWRDAWCADKNGQHGHSGYRPPAALRRIITSRHSTCVFPTCNRRVEHCDLDHTIAYDAHGPTCGCNLAPLCRRHHRGKQTPGWRLFQPWPGLIIWITPAGTWHIVQPE